MKKVGLLTRLIIGLIFGILVGYVSKEFLQFDALVRLLATFNGIFGGFLSYVIPLIIMVLWPPVLLN